MSINIRGLLAILIVGISLGPTCVNASTIEKTITGLLDEDDLIDTLRYRYDVPDAGLEEQLGSASIEITLKREAGPDVTLKKTYEMSESHMLVYAPAKGTIAIFESGVLSGAVKQTSYYRYNDLIGDWFLEKVAVENPDPTHASATYEFRYLKGTIGIEGQSISEDKARVESAEKRKTRLQAKLIKLHESMLALYKRKQLGQINVKDICKQPELAELTYNVPVTKETVEFYNNIGFFLEDMQGGDRCAIYILRHVLQAIPGRTPAYLNIADAYYDLDFTEQARQAYSDYVERMNAQGKRDRIPSRVWDRLKLQ